MKKLLVLALLAAASGCGNKMDLPVEQKGGAIPFSGYFVYGVWENIGFVTDIAVTRSQWLYIAEDSATVSRYKRKGANENGTNVARVVDTIPGLARPLYVDEGADDHLAIVDLETVSLPVPPDSVEERILTVPHVRVYDLFSQAMISEWSDAAWAPIDSFYRFPGRDSTRSERTLRDVMVTGIAADETDLVFVAGRSLLYREVIVRRYDTTFTTGGQIDSMTLIGADTSYADTTLAWSIRKYEADGTFLGEAAGDGTGLGYGRLIRDVALSADALVFVDGGTNRVKVNDPAGESAGIEWLDGTEIAGTEGIPFLLYPAGVAVDPLGGIYVSDGGNSRVLKYDRSLRYRDRVDRNGAGLLGGPGAVAATDSLVYVYDGGTAPKIVLFQLPKAEQQ
jgi:hypothetical protein